MFAAKKPSPSPRRRDRDRSTRPTNRARPMLEAMEGRNLLTVVFTPNFGPETVLAGSKYEGMQSPPVYVIYQGDYYTTAAGQQDEARITAAVRSIVTGPYLSGLTQYGSDGKATFGGAYTIDNNINNALPVARNLPFSSTDLYNFVQRDITGKLVPSPIPFAHTPIYVVITDPNAISTQAGAAGYNIPATGSVHAIWAGTQWASGQVGKQIDLDTLTQIVSHEIAETITDPDGKGIHVAPPSGLPVGLIGSNQIGDDEADGRRYQYRLNGYQVQPYYSANDRAFIVPDGNSERFQLVPIWNGSNFTGQYQLNAGLDRTAAPKNDAFLVTNGGPNGAGTAVTFDGQSVAFDQGRLRYLYLATDVGGTSQVQVNNAEPGQTVTAEISGVNNSVVVGSGTVSGIRGTVNVSNNSAPGTTLTVNDSFDPRFHAWTVNPGQIKLDNQGTIDFEAGPGSTLGLTSEVLETSTVAPSFVDVEGVGTEPFNILFRPGLAVFAGPAFVKVHLFGY